MKFERWFRTDDTPQWSRKARRFLLFATVLLVVGTVVWWVVR